MSELPTLVSLARAQPTPVRLVCPCGGEVVLGGRAEAAWCFCGHAEHHAGDVACYRPKCRCQGAPEDHPTAVCYRCITCGVVRRSLADLVPVARPARPERSPYR